MNSPTVSLRAELPSPHGSKKFPQNPQKIPENFPYPVLVAQHLPGTFAPHFIQRLGSLSQLPVLEATDRLAIAPGTIYIAKGGTAAQVVRRADLVAPTPAEPLACPFCGHDAHVRDFLTFGSPVRPARPVRPMR